MDSHQANLEPYHLLLNSCLRFNLTPTFLGVTFDRTLSFSKHVFSLKATLFPRLKAFRCISASSLAPLRSPSVFCINLFFGFFFFFFYLPYLSSIHEKANCIAILWTGSPHSLGCYLFRGVCATCFPHKGGASR